MWPYALSFADGTITVLSPCVLPVLPIVVGSAGQQHRHGPVALAAGLTLSFVAVGMMIASVGIAVGLDGGIVRMVGAALLILVGVFLLSKRLQHRFENTAAPVASKASQWTEKPVFSGLAGQFFVGTLLGAIWSPCTGPTLGAAIGLATQSGTQLQAASIMTLFGVGASVPVLALGYGAQALVARNRNRFLAFGAKAKGAMGFALIAVGGFVITGFDKVMEAVILNRLPAAWLDFITKI